MTPYFFNFSFGEDKTVCTNVLPTDIRSSRKAPVTSEGFLHPIPTSIPPLTLEAEQIIIGALMHELNEEFGLGLSTDPDHSRTMDPDTAHDTGRTVFIGASHMRRVAAALGAAGGSVVNVCPPGWSPTRESLLSAAERVSELRMGTGDTLILDIWSNSANSGNRRHGLPKKTGKK